MISLYPLQSVCSYFSQTTFCFFVALFANFFSRVNTAMLIRDINIEILSVSPSVRLSRSGIVLNRLNIYHIFFGVW